MASIDNATHEELVFVLHHFYPDMIFRLDGNDYDGLFVFPESPTPKPPLQELIDLMPQARQLIIERRAYERKVRAFQLTYPVQDQIINLFTAIFASGNFAELKQNPTLVAMRNHWQSL